MTFEIWLVYLATVLVFMFPPGPSHLLMLSNSLASGFKRAKATVAGDLSANSLQMLAAALGLASVLQSSQSYFLWIKWAGVCYLAYLGLKLLLSKHSILKDAQPQSMQQLYWQGFITSAANPKAVLFFAALFPQFINANAPLAEQFFILGLTYLVIDGTFLCLYGLCAANVAKRCGNTISRYANTISGSLFIGAAILLGLKDIEKVR